MVNAIVDNEAIQIQLDSSETVTVPTGEVWKVTVVVSDDDTSTIRGNLTINGVRAVYPPSPTSSFEASMVFTGGDTLEAGSGAATVNISGFVVNK